ncbi:MAG TPA: Maf family protein [Steroidobacteraceae bacterium]|nr:Maf family protein [Steroidobacteraceae bacterium]
MRSLILASTSQYRRALLERLGVPFDVVGPAVEERPVSGEASAARARRLSLEKAQAVARHHPEAVVIGSDQVAASGSRVLDKPGDAESCRAQLGSLSGTVANFYTGCAVIVPGSEPAMHLDRTSVHFRVLSPAEIERYVEREKPFDCAGGFKAESLGVTLFDHINGVDPTALVGLPLIWLAGALRAAGFRLP